LVRWWLLLRPGKIPAWSGPAKHNLLDILAIPVCAVLCGADSWVAVERSGLAKFDWLSRFLSLPNAIPSHDTFGRFFAALLPEQFRSCFASWVTEVADGLGLKHGDSNCGRAGC